jgi:hypothetical protein
MDDSGRFFENFSLRDPIHSGDHLALQAEALSHSKDAYARATHPWPPTPLPVCSATERSGPTLRSSARARSMSANNIGREMRKELGAHNYTRGSTDPFQARETGGRYRVPTRRRTIVNFSGNVMHGCYASWNSLRFTREATLTGFEPVLPP